MRARVAVLALGTLYVAGCGGTHAVATQKPPSKLPRALAQSWAQQADAIAASIDAGDSCTALSRATALRAQVVGAVNARRVPRRYLESLVSTTNDLAGRIACTPPAPVVSTGKGKGHKHDKHGDNGDGGD